MEHFHGYSPSNWIEALRHERTSQALYKPAMLLVALDAIDEGQASPSLVPFTDDLERRFDTLLVAASCPGGEGKAWQPFFYLSTAVGHREPIWNLTNGGTIIVPEKGSVGSRAALLRRADAARFRPDLAHHLVTPAGRVGIREEIYRWVTSGHDPEAGERLVAAHMPLWPAVEREQAGMRESVSQPFRLFRQHLEVEISQQTRYARDWALRLEVLPLYDHRCALCELRLRYHARIEATAAHIVPVRSAGADDVRNAFSLCRTHHWAFDVGLWGVSEAGRAQIAPVADSDTVDLAALRELADKELSMPADPARCPAPEAFAWHREHVFEAASA